jgi:hypothetical protein
VTRMILHSKRNTHAHSVLWVGSIEEVQTTVDKCTNMLPVKDV